MLFINLSNIVVKFRYWDFLHARYDLYWYTCISDCHPSSDLIQSHWQTPSLPQTTDLQRGETVCCFNRRGVGWTLCWPTVLHKRRWRDLKLKEEGTWVRKESHHSQRRDAHRDNCWMNGLLILLSFHLVWGWMDWVREWKRGISRCTFITFGLYCSV